MSAPPAPLRSPPRRRWLATAGGAALALRAVGAPAFARHGRIEPPEPVPAIAMRLDDGSATTLARLLAGRITALHFMFTGCRSTCPIQAATFARLQDGLGALGDRVRLLSVSVDALGDDPTALARWRTRLSAGPRWRAAVPLAADASALLALAGGDRPWGPDTHATEVLLFDDRSRLAFRTTDLPDAGALAGLLAGLDATARR
ncbi:MAG: hypothetical protein RJA99_1943 [Pseudomonadota bacterium]|jgi:protein SCO1/2